MSFEAFKQAFRRHFDPPVRGLTKKVHRAELVTQSGSTAVRVSPNFCSGKAQGQYRLTWRGVTCKRCLKKRKGE